MNQIFRCWAAAVTTAVGRTGTFFGALFLLLLWGACGPYFHFSEVWQLVVNTSTSIITFLMVILIQNSQNRDTIAIHLKLDELMRAVGSARTGFVKLENLSDDELADLRKDFERLQARTRGSLSSHPHQTLASSPRTKRPTPKKDR